MHIYNDVVWGVWVWIWCVAVTCKMKRLYIVTVENDEIVETIFFWYLFNVHAFPYYFVMAWFLTPYFVVLFSIRWLYLEYRYSGWQGVAVRCFRGWRWWDALRLVWLFSSWISCSHYELWYCNTRVELVI